MKRVSICVGDLVTVPKSRDSDGFWLLKCLEVLKQKVPILSGEDFVGKKFTLKRLRDGEKYYTLVYEYADKDAKKLAEIRRAGFEVNEMGMDAASRNLSK